MFLNNYNLRYIKFQASNENKFINGISVLNKNNVKSIKAYDKK